MDVQDGVQVAVAESVEPGCFGLITAAAAEPPAAAVGDDAKPFGVEARHIACSSVIVASDCPTDALAIGQVDIAQPRQFLPADDRCDGGNRQAQLRADAGGSPAAGGAQVYDLLDHCPSRLGRAAVRA